MLKESIGGTEGVLAKREEAWRIVPSPPKVAVKSTFLASKEDRYTAFEVVVVTRGIVFIGMGRRWWRSYAGACSRMKHIDG